MANPVIVDIPGIGPVEATNAATEQTLKEILKAIQKGNSARGGGGPAGGIGGGLGGGLGGGGAGMGKQTAAVSKGMGALATKLGGVAAVAGQVAMKFLEVGAASAKLIQQFSNVGDDLQSAADTFRSIPLVGGVLADTFGAVAQASQKSAKAFQDAASAGASFGGSMNNFIRTASQAGMTMEQFGALIKANGSGMLGFGSTVEEGAKRFGQVSKALRSSSDDLYALGFSTQDLNDGLAKYGNLMRLTGRSQNMTNQQLAEGAKSYLKELDALAKITGEDRKTKEAQMEALAKDGQYQAKLATKDEKVRKSFDAMMIQVPGELQAFVKDFITTGTATTEENAKMAALYGPEIMGQLQIYHQKLNRGEELTVAERNRMNNLLAEGSKKVMAQYGDTLAANREYDGVTRNIVAGLKIQTDGVKKVNAEQEAAAKNQEKLNKKIEESKAKLAEYSNSFTQALINSGMLDSLMQAFGTFANFVSTFIIPIFKVFGMILKPVVSFISDVLNPVFKAVGERINAILMPFQYLGYWLDKVSGDFNIVSTAMNVLLLPFNLMTEALKLFYRGIITVFDAIEDFLAPVFSFLGRIVDSVVKTFKDYFQPIITDTATWFKNTFRSIMSTLSPVINPVVEGFKLVRKAVGDFFNSFNTLGEVVTSIRFAFRGLGLQLKEMWYAIKDAIPGLTDTTKEERENLEKEKEALAEDRKGHDQQLEKNRQENQKIEEENQRKRDAARRERDKAFFDTRDAREKAHQDAKDAAAKAEEEKKGGVNWADPASVLKHHMGAMKQPGAQTQAPSAAPGTAAPNTAQGVPASAGLGAMAAKFESGRAGSAAVGWDSTGGTSYGKYQIATKTGTMNKFMEHLKATNPEAYARLSKAGPADAGKDGAFAQEWKKLAGEGKLAQSEHEFIKKTHYDVGAKGLKDKNLQAMLEKSKALQEVMWSTSVQHGGGGASGIFNKVYKEGMTEQDLIKAIYAERGQRFGSSTAQVRASVQNRFAQEQQLALGLVGQPGAAGAMPTSTEMANAVAAGQQAKNQTAQAMAANAPAGNKAQQAAGGTSKPMAPAQESAESLLASLNSKMDQLIAINKNLGDLNERQLRVQKSFSQDGYVAA